ncbi:hypothetical protein LINGRAHAP2_LOCUS29334 [Linum grandiflorum]
MYVGPTLPITRGSIVQKKKEENWILPLREPELHHRSLINQQQQLLPILRNRDRIHNHSEMGFLVTTLIFLVVGIIASLCARICCNRGPSTNLYVSLF